MGLSDGQVKYANIFFFSFFESSLKQQSMAILCRSIPSQTEITILALKQWVVHQSTSKEFENL